MTQIATHYDDPESPTRIVRETMVLGTYDGEIDTRVEIKIERLRPVEYGACAFVETGGGRLPVEA